MRTLTDTEKFMQMMTIESNRDHFVTVNTNPMADYEQVSGEWVPVHRIRYEGSFGGRNTWGL